MAQKLKAQRQSFYGLPQGTSFSYAPAAITNAGRAPTSGDTGYDLGQEWIFNGTVYTLASVSAGSATWEISAGGTGAVATLTGDSGVATPVGGNINILGTANQISTIGSGDDITASLSATLIAPGSLEVTSGFTVDAGAITMQSGIDAINISTDAAATTINIGTGAAVKTVTLGSSNGASITSIACGTGGIGVGTSANAHTSTFGSVTGNSSTSIACGTGGCALGASANAHATTVGSTTTTSTTTIQSGTGGLALNAAGLVSVAPAANAVAGTTLTIDSRVCTAQFTGQTTAAGSATVFTINNALLTDVTQAVIVSASNLGANDAQMTIYRVVKAVGSVAVTLHNNGAAALNGDVYITLWLLN